MTLSAMFNRNAKFMVIRSNNAGHHGFPVRNRNNGIIPAGYSLVAFADNSEEVNAVMLRNVAN